jgi:hypothetical protein
LAGCATLRPVALGPPIKFHSDKCSDPTGLFKKAAYEDACCVPHDRAYWRGGTEADRLRADIALRDCVAAHGYPLDAVLMFPIVRAAGGPEFDTSYRWGFGWPYPHPYTRKDPS